MIRLLVLIRKNKVLATEDVCALRTPQILLAALWRLCTCLKLVPNVITRAPRAKGQSHKEHFISGTILIQRHACTGARGQAIGVIPVLWPLIPVLRIGLRNVSGSLRFVSSAGIQIRYQRKELLWRPCRSKSKSLGLGIRSSRCLFGTLPQFTLSHLPSSKNSCVIGSLLWDWSRNGWGQPIERMVESMLSFGHGRKEPSHSSVRHRSSTTGILIRLRAPQPSVNSPASLVGSLSMQV